MEKYIMTPQLEQYIESQGWMIECESPLEIRHDDGSFATQAAAKAVIAQLQEEFEAEDHTAKYSKHRGNLNALEIHTKALADLNEINQRIQTMIEKSQEKETADGNDSVWSTTFDLLFPNLSSIAYQALEELNLSLDYYDPDTSYAEDIMAFANALKAKVEEVNNLT
jgi:hypothetical protein